MSSVLVPLGFRSGTMTWLSSATIIRRCTPSTSRQAVALAAGMFPTVPLVLGGIGFSIDPQFWLAGVECRLRNCSAAVNCLFTRLLGSLIRGEGAVDDIPGIVVAGKPPNRSWVPERLDPVHRGHLDYEAVAAASGKRGFPGRTSRPIADVASAATSVLSPGFMAER